MLILLICMCQSLAKYASAIDDFKMSLSALLMQKYVYTHIVLIQRAQLENRVANPDDPKTCYDKVS